MTKFVGKFRKDKEYNDDSRYTVKRSKNENIEIKKLLTQYEKEEILEQEEAESEDQKGWYR